MKKRVEKRNAKSWLKTALLVFLMLVWVFASIIAAQLVVGYIMVWILGPEKFEQPVFAAIYSAVAYALAMALIIFVPWKIMKTNRVELGLRGWPTWTDIGLAPAGFIIYLILAAILVWIFSLFPWFDAAQEQEIVFNSYLFGFDRIVAFITLVVVAPIAEEIIFRGWLYGKMRTKLPMAVSIFLVSVLFGMIHMQWNVGVNVFAMSVVLCGLREVTGTIYAGILLHMLKNGVAFYLLYVLGI